MRIVGYKKGWDILFILLTVIENITEISKLLRQALCSSSKAFALVFSSEKFSYSRVLMKHESEHSFDSIFSSVLMQQQSN